MIDYELAEKIGATHYDTDNSSLFKLSDSALLKYKDENWSYCNTTGASALTYIKPIPPRKQPPYEYVKAEYNHAWEALQSIEQGVCDLFLKRNDGSFGKAVPQHALTQKDRLYRRVEKKVNWRDEVENYIKSIPAIDGTTSGLMQVSRHGWVSMYALEDVEFLEMCKLAYLTAKANGEIE